MLHPNTSLSAALLSICLLAFATSCSSEKTDVLTAEQTAKVERIGSDASLALKKSLGTQLKAALQSGGPENALKVCQQIAQPITNQTSETQAAATVTRTALRVRNPVNAPTESDRAVLSEWENLLAEGKALPPSKVIRTSENQAIYYQPIITESICLKCHGDPSGFSPDLSQKITKLYPEDQAINFSEGDLRGAFRVAVELD